MATKKQTGSAQQAAAKPAARKPAARKPAAKKNSRKNGKMPKKAVPQNGPFRPEVLADLASKLVRLKIETPTDGSRSGHLLTDRAFEAAFADALKRAEMLLLAASGNTDNEVHAYQLFSENDGLMSFEEIATRFRDFEWSGMIARNTVEPIIKELVISAESKVQEERDRHDRLVSVRCRYPGGVHYLVDRVRRHIRNMIVLTGLRDLFDDPKQVADMMGQYFFRLMEKNIPGDWERHLDEEYATVAGFESFIEYVCGGLTYERFIGDPPQVWMDLERLGSFVFFLESLGVKYSQKNGDQAERRGPSPAVLEEARQKISEQDLRSLMRLVLNRNDVPHEATIALDVCLEELNKKDPEVARVGQFACTASLSLRAMWERWYLTELVFAQRFWKLINELGDSGSELNRAGQFPADKVEEILGLLRRANEVGEAKAKAMEAGEIRQLLDDLRQSLEDSSLVAAAKVPARRFDGLIADELRRVAGGLKKGLRMKPPAKRHAKQSLSDLLRDLKPYSGERKCRPYELFLFAAQNRLLKDKLVRRLVGFIPNPPYPSSLPILKHHRGADIVMGIKDPG